MSEPETEPAQLPVCFAIIPITMPKGERGNYAGRWDHFKKVSQHIFKPAAEEAGFQFMPPVAEHARASFMQA